MSERSDVTATGLAVAVICLARFIKVERPGLIPYLQLSLAKAGDVGIADADLAFLRRLIGSLGCSDQSAER